MDTALISLSINRRHFREGAPWRGKAPPGVCMCNPLALAINELFVLTNRNLYAFVTRQDASVLVCCHDTMKVLYTFPDPFNFIKHWESGDYDRVDTVKLAFLELQPLLKEIQQDEWPDTTNTTDITIDNPPNFRGEF